MKAQSNAGGFTLVPHNYYQSKHPTYDLTGRGKDQKRRDKIERCIWNKKQNDELESCEQKKMINSYPETHQLEIPLLFWFSTSTELSIPYVAIPYEQRLIKIESEDLTHSGG